MNKRTTLLTFLPLLMMLSASAQTSRLADHPYGVEFLNIEKQSSLMRSQQPAELAGAIGPFVAVVGKAPYKATDVADVMAVETAKFYNNTLSTPVAAGTSFRLQLLQVAQNQRIIELLERLNAVAK